MGLFETVLFLFVAILIFLLFDLLKIRLTTGYSPTNVPSLIVYGPYTLIRVIIVSVVYYLVVKIPELFNITMTPEVQQYIPFIAGITVPFLYLGLFSILGGSILKSGGDLGKKLDRWFKKVETTIANESRDIVIWQIIRRMEKDPANWTMDNTRNYFCAQVQMLGSNPDPLACKNELDSTRNEIVAVYGPETERFVKYSIICAWVAWIDGEYPKSSVTSGPPSANILRKFAKLSIT